MHTRIPEFHSPCNYSSQCPLDSGACVFISQESILKECSNSLPTAPAESCFCAPQSGSFQHGRCEINTAQLSTSFDRKFYCVACAHVAASNISFPSDICSTVYTFPAPQKGENGSYFQSCTDDVDCHADLACANMLDNKYILYSESGRIVTPSHTNLNVSKSSFCFQRALKECNIYSTCNRNESCVRLGYRYTTVCLPTDALQRTGLKLPTSPGIRNGFLFLIGLTEVAFIIMKSTFVLKKRCRWQIVGLICFIIESMLGLVLASIQAYMVISSRDRENDDSAVNLGAVMFVFTALCAITPETISVWKKVNNIYDHDTNGHNVNKFRFSLLRRIVARLLTMTTTLFALVNAIDIVSYYVKTDANERANGRVMSIVLFVTVVLYGVTSIICYSRYWTRIILSFIVFVFAILTIIVMSIRRISFGGTKYCDSIFHSMEDSSDSSFDLVIASIYMLGINIFATAVSGFRLQGYTEVNNITPEQVEFFETGIFGIIGPSFVIAVRTNLCFKKISLLLLVAIPQVLVMLIPLAIEYCHHWFSS